MGRMDNSLGTGFVAVFAVSGSVVLLALQVHKRLLSDFMKKMEFEIGTSKKYEAIKNKKVRFAKEADNKNAAGARNSSYLQAINSAGRSGAVEEKLETLPLNWQVLYKGIIENRVLKGVY